ncbi:hypothetical protein [Idiomarina piscisalsi]|uniref:Uncharacterized protein n=1 Tax=Idiomarina piscisalsi TaxID=1096243 RepID=A0A432YXD3_9GAMM|nr:hypothetical protein [Idiomarina piscisalsi]RUO67983.1 hypothetical protein CWI73_03765 [Idiomarina piscisalsi]
MSANTTPFLGLRYLAWQQYNKEAVVNEAFNKIDEAFQGQQAAQASESKVHDVGADSDITLVPDARVIKITDSGALLSRTRNINFDMTNHGLKQVVIWNATGHQLNLSSTVLGVQEAVSAVIDDNSVIVIQ